MFGTQLKIRGNYVCRKQLLSCLVWAPSPSPWHSLPTVGSQDLGDRHISRASLTCTASWLHDDLLSLASAPGSRAMSRRLPVHPSQSCACSRNRSEAHDGIRDSPALSPLAWTGRPLARSPTRSFSLTPSFSLCASRCASLSAFFRHCLFRRIFSASTYIRPRQAVLPCSPRNMKRNNWPWLSRLRHRQTALLPPRAGCLLSPGRCSSTMPAYPRDAGAGQPVP